VRYTWRVDLLLRAITDDDSLRVLAAVTTDLVAEACRRHELLGVEAIALGRALTAGCLLTTLSKSPHERLRVDLRSEGPLGGVLIDASGDGGVRGCLRRSLGDNTLRDRLELASGRLPLSPFMGRRGALTVTRDLGPESRYQGTVELTTGEVDADLEHYLNVSEQLPSLLHCDVVLDGRRRVLRAGGVLFQTFPGGDRAALAEIRRTLDDDSFAALLLQPREPADLARFALGGAQFREMGESPLRFRCKCGPDTARGVLSTLGAEDLDALAEERESTEVRCSYCGARYVVGRAALRALAAELRSMRS